jgi:hypothetical protein
MQKLFARSDDTVANIVRAAVDIAGVLYPPHSG